MIKKICAVCAAMTAMSVFGVNWDGISGNYNGDYQNPLMWNTGVVPTDVELVYFLKPDAYTVAINGVVTNNTTEFRGTGGSPYNVNVAFGSGARLVVRTNLYVKSGVVAYPTRVVFNGGAVDVLNSLQSGNSGLNDKYSELYLTNNTFTTSGSYFYVGTAGSGNALVIGPGSCYTGVQIVMGDNGAASSNRVEVSGAGSRFLIPGNQIRIGLSGSYNSFTAANGAEVRLSTLAVGTNPGGNSNRVDVSNSAVTLTGGSAIFGGKGWWNTIVFGAGSSFTTLPGGGTLYVGQDTVGSYNRASFIDGAVVTNVLPIYIGSAITNNNNVLEVTASTFIHNNGTIIVGNYGSSNALLVTGGSRFFIGSGSLICGYYGSAVGNRIVFSGADVALTNDLYIGNNGGTGNSVAFTNTTFNIRGTTYIGNNNATGNVFLAGTGTSITSIRPLNIANNATSRENEMRLDNAEATFGNAANPPGVNSSYIGANGDANLISIRGSAGRLINTNAALYVGYFGSYNRLIIENGGRLWVRGLLIGDQYGSSNSLYIAGTGSRIDSFDSDIRVGGGSSTGSVCVASDGAIIDAGNNNIGVNYGSGAIGASLIVSNAVLICTNNSFFAQNDARITFAGTNNLLRAKNLQLRNTATIAFAISRAGLPSTNAVIQTASDLTLTGTPVLQISAQDWAQRTGGRVTLLTYGGNLSGDLAALASTAQLDSPALTVTVVGKSLVLTAPRRDGTVLRLY